MDLRMIFNAQGADYGRILYQQLIFLRSVTAYYFLTYFHYAVLIADVDTIWLTNPLSQRLDRVADCISDCVPGRKSLSE
jgi:hypothetical protein